MRGSSRASAGLDSMTGMAGKLLAPIINEVKGINRVVYDVTSKSPGTIEWE